jgi:CheY-like chemotaxis protein
MNQHIIFWADDDPDDRETFQQVLSEVTTQFQLQEFSNGEQLLKRLQNLEEGLYPSLIILDINMPVLDGRATLTALKESSRYQGIAVVVFTTSNSEKDREFCHRYHTEMITKPPSLEQLKEMVQKMLCFLDSKKKDTT